MTDPIIRRIERELGVPDLASVLAGAPGTDLKSLLMRVHRLRAGKVTPSSLLRAYARTRMVQPNALDPRRLAEIVAAAYRLLPTGFEPLELSPVAPLGAVAALTNLDQDQVLTTIAGAEVSSDPTNLLALEYALRRRRASGKPAYPPEPLHLATCARVVRPLAPEKPGVFPHFTLLALCSGGIDPGNHRFERSAFAAHIGCYLALIRHAPGIRAGSPPPEVLLSSFGEATPPWLDTLAVKLREDHPDVRVSFDPKRQQGRNYYRGAAFNIYLTSAGGRRFQLADGGLVDWAQELLNSRKERLLISALGLERLAAEL